MAVPFCSLLKARSLSLVKSTGHRAAVLILWVPGEKQQGFPCLSILLCCQRGKQFHLILPTKTKCTHTLESASSKNYLYNPLYIPEITTCLDDLQVRLSAKFTQQRIETVNTEINESLTDLLHESLLRDVRL